MRRISLGLLATTSLVAFATVASAADLARPVYKAPPPPPPVCNWCGFYVGVNAGGTWSRNDVQTIGTPVSAAATFASEANVAAALATNSVAAGQAGFIGGGQIGYNYQLANYVVGVEADIQGLANNNRSNTLSAVSGVPGFPTETFTSITTVSKRVDYLGTLRGRAGFLITPSVLVYATGGLAYGQVNASTTISQTDTGILPGPVTAAYTSTGSFSQTRAGWTVGAGAEAMMWSNWSVKLEYLYYDLGSISYALPNLVANAPTFPAPTWVAAAVSSTRFTGNVFRVGLNYKFGWAGPVYAAY